MHESEQFPFCSETFFSFLKEATDQEIELLDNIGLIFISPDSFSSHIVEDILKFLESNGVLFLDANILDSFTEEDIAHFISRNIKNSFRWWIVQRRFVFGPVGALLVASKTKLDTRFAIELKRIKGFRIPNQASEFSLRGSFPTINGSFNFIHTPDDSANLLRDAGPFFNSQQIIKVISQLNEIYQGTARSLSIDTIMRNYFCGYNGYKNYCESFSEVYLCILLRVVAHIFVSVEPVGKLLELQILLNQSLQKVRSLRSTREKLTVLLEIKNTVSANCLGQPDFRVLESQTGNENKMMRLIDVLSILLEFHKYPNMDWIKFVGHIRSSGIQVNDWEEVILISSLFSQEEEMPPVNL